MPLGPASLRAGRFFPLPPSLARPARRRVIDGFHPAGSAYPAPVPVGRALLAWGALVGWGLPAWRQVHRTLAALSQGISSRVPALHTGASASRRGEGGGSGAWGRLLGYVRHVVTWRLVEAGPGVGCLGSSGTWSRACPPGRALPPCAGASTALSSHPLISHGGSPPPVPVGVGDSKAVLAHSRSPGSRRAYCPLQVAV